MNENNPINNEAVNAISELAIEANYYDTKSQELFEILSQLNDWADSQPCDVTFSIAINNQHVTALPIPIAAWSPIATVITELYNYYKTRALKANAKLSDIRNFGEMPT